MKPVYRVEVLLLGNRKTNIETPDRATALEFFLSQWFTQGNFRTITISKTPHALKDKKAPINKGEIEAEREESSEDS